MKALTFEGIRNITFREVPDPVIKDPGDAIIRIEYSAVCGSDLHVYHGRETGLDKGTVMGHEFTGEIVETGEEVNSFHIGDKVISPFTTSCGNCYFCRIGLTSRCVNGQLFGWVEKGEGLHGAQAEYLRVPLANTTLMKYPETVSPILAMFSGDILATGFYCAEMARVNREGIYIVLGCGPVGLMAIMSAREMGAQKIFAADSVTNRLEIARSFGAVPINIANQDPVDIIFDHTMGIGADAVMEAVGTHEATKMAFQLVRPGGIISTVGVHTDREFAFTPVEAYDKNITFNIGRCPARFYMERLIRKLEDNKLDPGRIITHQFDLTEGKHAYEIFDKKEDNCLKIVLNC